MTPIISAINLSKRFVQSSDRAYNLKTSLVRLCRGQRSQSQLITVLDNVSFDIMPGEVVGVLGRNGTGKSTLFRLLSGIYAPDAGRIEVRGKCVPLVGLGAGFHPELTGYENIYLNGAVIGFSRREIHQSVDAIVEFSELGEKIHLATKNYSSGMILRLGFAIAVHLNAQILLLDEILGVGDEGFQRKSVNKILELIRSGRTIVLVSHDTNAILRHCTRCMVMDQGRVIFDGNPADGVRTYSNLFASVEDASLKPEPEVTTC